MGLLLTNIKQVYFNDYSFYTQVFKNFRITKAPNSVARSFAEILLGERKAVYNFHNRRHTEYSKIKRPDLSSLIGGRQVLLCTKKASQMTAETVLSSETMTLVSLKKKNNKVGIGKYLSKITTFVLEQANFAKSYGNKGVSVHELTGKADMGLWLTEV